MLMKSLFTIADRAAVGSVRPAHPRPPAGARRAPALGAAMRAAAGRESRRRWWPRMTSCWRRAWWKRARTAASSCARAAASLCRRRPSRAMPTSRSRPGRRRTGLAAPRADAPIERHGADPRHVPQGQQQAAARHGRVPARLDGIDLHARGGAQGDQHPVAAASSRCSTASRWATAACAACFRNKLATLSVHAAPENIITTVGATHALDIVSRTLLRAGRPGDGGGARLGGGVRAAQGDGHAPAARAAPGRRAGPGGDGEVLRGAQAQALCQRERVPQPHRLLPDAGQRAPHAAAGQPARLPHRRGRHLQPYRARARDAPVRARWPAAHHPRQRLRQDPGAELAGRLPGGAAIADRAAAGHQAAGHADHARPCWKRRWPCAWSRASCAGMPSASRHGWTRRAAAASSWR